jgi:type II secretory pathway pseudopilin PulG
MTLLEALLALVILGLSAVGYLDVFQGSARSAAHSEEWIETVAIAESAMEFALLGGGAAAQPLSDVRGQFSSRVETVPFAAGLSEIVVTVTSPRGTTFALRRVIRNTRLPAHAGSP